MTESFLADRVELHCGDCLDVLATRAENSLDACVTDPPYGIQFMGRGWDHGVPGLPYWRQVYRVLKPGAHLIAMGGTRTYHRLACAIEDAGFEIRDTVSWLYGSGFPKSHDVSKGIDKAAGALTHRAKGFNHAGIGPTISEAARSELRSDHPDYEPYAARTDAAREWQGWGTALKPACELIVLARKPLSEGTVAANVLRWGTGAINVDGCRVPGVFESGWSQSGSKAGENTCMSGPNYARDPKPNNGNGRWPANVVHDGSDEVVAAFPDSNSAVPRIEQNSGRADESQYRIKPTPGTIKDFGDNGSASRFFYTSKADADDRLGSKHPTVKPVDLMQWLVRLVTPKGGLVLDPFAGTGTTGEAAWREGMRAVLIEAEPEYQADIRRRMALALAGPDERIRESIKARGMPIDYGPLFDGLQEAAE